MVLASSRPRAGSLSRPPSRLSLRSPPRMLSPSSPPGIVSVPPPPLRVSLPSSPLIEPATALGNLPDESRVTPEDTVGGVMVSPFRGQVKLVMRGMLPRERSSGGGRLLGPASRRAHPLADHRRHGFTLEVLDLEKTRDLLGLRRCGLAPKPNFAREVLSQPSIRKLRVMACPGGRPAGLCRPAPHTRRPAFRCIDKGVRADALPTRQSPGRGPRAPVRRRARTPRRAAARPRRAPPGQAAAWPSARTDGRPR